MALGKRLSTGAEGFPYYGGCTQIHGKPGFARAGSCPVLRAGAVRCSLSGADFILLWPYGLRRNGQAHGVFRVMAAGQADAGIKFRRSEHILFPPGWSRRNGKKMYPAQAAVADARAQRTRRQMPPSPENGGKVHGGDRDGNVNFPAFLLTGRGRICMDAHVLFLPILRALARKITLLALLACFLLEVLRIFISDVFSSGRTGH